MKLFDLHCDTLGRSIDENKDLFSKNFHTDISKCKKFDGWIQCFAIFIPDEIRGNDALKLFNCAKEKLLKSCANSNGLTFCNTYEDLKNFVPKKCNAIFTVEGGAVLAGNISNLEHLNKSGVKMMTLTWNGECEIGSGAFSQENSGLSEFGKKVVKRMQELNMAIDVSHASDKLFFDVLDITKAPIVASHSNSRAVCKHRRNLTDEQFGIIKDRGGLVGLNFCKDFLSSGDDASAYDILKHAEHFLSLGGENTVCLGSDFDGASMPRGVTGTESMLDLYELFLKSGYNETLVDNIFFNNAYNYFEKLLR